MTYDRKVYQFAVAWVDAMELDQSKHHYPDIVHRLSIQIQTAIEEFTEDLQSERGAS